jgi:hypothetical protein
MEQGLETEATALMSINLLNERFSSRSFSVLHWDQWVKLALKTLN